MDYFSRHLNALRAEIEGELLTDDLTRALYATDASPYQRLPLGVVRPSHRDDCIKLMQFALRHRIPMIPRGAGTSLAGQCVGEWLVVDMACHMNRILEMDPEQRCARVQPGVVLSYLNDALCAHGLRFAPDPSTANRCTIGGMVGNNAWGVHAVRDGTTRDSVEAIEAILSDGRLAWFGPLEEDERRQKLALSSREGEIYRTVCRTVEANLAGIRARYPGARGIPNNAGYALDVIARQKPWEPQGPPFNLAPLLCGAEGTLVLITEVTVRLVAYPKGRVMVCAHFQSLGEAMQGVELAMSASPAAVELLDRRVLELTRTNPEQSRHRFWIEGAPEAVLLIEFTGDNESRLLIQARAVIDGYRARRLGYAFPVLTGEGLDPIWDLRRAGLGLLMGMPGSRKAVSGIEDVAVRVTDLPRFTREVLDLMRSDGVQCVVYGSVSMGAVHLRPELDLRSARDLRVFETLLAQVAALIGRYGGSFSAKHGDGRLRAPFLAYTLGEEIVRLLREIKRSFDPENLLNPGKILDPPPITTDLRLFKPEETVQAIPAYFSWGETGGLLGATERCHGAGACLKSAGRGTMCPSYMATREELHSTRGRANLLRQALASPDPHKRFTSRDLYQALDLCLACKGCRSECPASVDMARLKAEFLEHYHDRHGLPWRAWILGRFADLSRLASLAPYLSNILLRQARIKQWLGLHPNRALPELAAYRFSAWFRRHEPSPLAGRWGRVILLLDPLTEFYEPGIGQAATEVLERLGYEVQSTPCLPSGRVEISQGLLRRARRTLARAVAALYPHARAGLPIVGIEPSELFTFRDEAKDLLSGGTLREQARIVAAQVLTFEEFIVREAHAGRIDEEVFDRAPRQLLLHVHCHQKSLTGLKPSVDALSLIPEASVQVIPSGCCGMAGAFGYEAEHYDLSNRIGELVLFPAIRKAPANAIIVATGMSCRHQIRAGTNVYPWHPAQVLASSLKCRVG